MASADKYHNRVETGFYLSGNPVFLPLSEQTAVSLPHAHSERLAWGLQASIAVHLHVEVSDSSLRVVRGLHAECGRGIASIEGRTS